MQLYVVVQAMQVGQKLIPVGSAARNPMALRARLRKARRAFPFSTIIRWEEIGRAKPHESEHP